MVFGIILVLMMIFRPQGIFPARRRQREPRSLKAGARQMGHRAGAAA